MELKPEELEAKNTADQQWLAGINSSYISCRGSFIGLKHTTIAKMFRRCEECIELRSAVIAQAAEIARLTARVAELEEMLLEIVNSIPATYDETNPDVKRHAAALNTAWKMFKGVRHG